MSVTATNPSSVEAAGADAGSRSRLRGKLQQWAPRGILAFVMLFTGAAGLIYEYIMSTVSTYLVGNSIVQFSITIGIMFFMMGVGGLLQKLIRGGLVEAFILAELLLVLLGGFIAIALQWLFANAESDFGWMKFAYTCLIGLLIGVEIPLVMRINERFTRDLRSNIAGTWAWDYIGGALGVVIWIWLLLNYVPITHISFWIAGCNMAVAIVSLVFFWRRGLLQWRISGPLAAVGSVGVTIALVFGLTNVDAWSKVISQKLYEDPIVTQMSTKYQQIVITKGVHPTDPMGASYRLYLNGNTQFDSADEAIYHEHLVHPAMNLAAERRHVLILGGGDGMALREVLKYPEVQDVTLVDLDPDMIKLATTNPILKELNQGSFSDARVHSSVSPGVVNTGEKRDVLMETGETEVDCRGNSEGSADCTTEPVTESIGTVDVFTVDADRFVSVQNRLYDVVIVDLPDPNSIELAKLYSLEFYQKVKQVLSPDGIVVVQATSPYHAKETYLCILRTMATAGLGVVPYHDNVPSFGDWGWILGSPNLPGKALYEKTASLSAFPVETKEVDENVVRRALIFNRGWLDSSSREISTLMRPTVFDYYTYEAWKVD